MCVCKVCVKSKHVGVRCAHTWGCNKACLGCIRGVQVRGAPAVLGVCEPRGVCIVCVRCE